MAPHHRVLYNHHTLHHPLRLYVQPIVVIDCKNTIAYYQYHLQGIAKDIICLAIGGSY